MCNLYKSGDKKREGIGDFLPTYVLFSVICAHFVNKQNVSNQRNPYSIIDAGEAFGAKLPPTHYYLDTL